MIPFIHLYPHTLVISSISKGKILCADLRAFFFQFCLALKHTKRILTLNGRFFGKLIIHNRTIPYKCKIYAEIPFLTLLCQLKPTLAELNVICLEKITLICLSQLSDGIRWKNGLICSLLRRESTPDFSCQQRYEF